MKVENHKDLKDDFEFFASKFREEIDCALSEKTGWGRNELKLKLEIAMANAMMKTLARTK